MHVGWSGNLLEMKVLWVIEVTNTFDANILKQSTYRHTNLSYLKAYYVMLKIFALVTFADSSGFVCFYFFLRRNHIVLRDVLFKSVTILFFFCDNAFSSCPRNLLNSYATQTFFFFLLTYSKTFSCSSTPFLTCQYIGKHPTSQVNNII